MKSLVLVLIALALALALPLSGLGQDGGDPPPAEEEGPAPAGVPGVILTQKQRIEKEIEGVWLLTNYQSGQSAVDPTNVKGFAMFEDGYATLVFMAVDPEVESPNVRQMYVQGGAHRYQITDFLTVQLATILGFNSFNSKAQVMMESTSFPREYRVSIENETMRFSRTDGTMFFYSRMQKTEFPFEALDALKAAKSGR